MEKLIRLSDIVKKAEARFTKTKAGKNMPRNFYAKLAAGWLIAGSGLAYFLGSAMTKDMNPFTWRASLEKNNREYNENETLEKRVLQKAFGDDKICEFSEGVRLARALGYDGLIKSDENITFSYGSYGYGKFNLVINTRNVIEIPKEKVLEYLTK